MQVALSEKECKYLKSKPKDEGGLMSEIRAVFESERLTPMKCMQQGVAMAEARQMKPDDLSREDCQALLKMEYPKHIIAQKYGFSCRDFFLKLKEWGLVKKGKQGARENRAHKEPAQPIGETKAEPAQEAGAISPAIANDTAAPAMEAPEALTPADLTREQAARLLSQGTTKQQIKKMYGFRNDALLYYKLERWGLHRRQRQGSCKTDPEDVKRMAKAVLEGEKRGIVDPPNSAQEPEKAMDGDRPRTDLKPRPATETELREMFEEPPVSSAVTRVIDGEKPVPGFSAEDGRGSTIKNTLNDLNNHLFAELKRLSDEDLNGEALTDEISRAKAITGVASQIIANGNLVLRANQFIYDNNPRETEKQLPRMLEN